MKSNILIFSLVLMFSALLTTGGIFANDKAEGDVTTGTAVGNLAPDIVLVGPNGKTMKLSELRGKVVLIDFWASWCRPCRVENPNIVEAYNKFNKREFGKAKGFEIYSVSLDKTKSQWVAAIDQDKLDWKYHVSDLAGWSSSAAKVYGVRSIPYNFLIDEHGIIRAKNLRGINLHYELEKMATD